MLCDGALKVLSSWCYSQLQWYCWREYFVLLTYLHDYRRQQHQLLKSDVGRLGFSYLIQILFLSNCLNYIINVWISYYIGLYIFFNFMYGCIIYYIIFNSHKLISMNLLKLIKLFLNKNKLKMSILQSSVECGYSMFKISIHN